MSRKEETLWVFLIWLQGEGNVVWEGILAISGDVRGCHKLRNKESCAWHLVGKEEGCCEQSTMCKPSSALQRIYFQPSRALGEKQEDRQPLSTSLCET